MLLSIFKHRMLVYTLSKRAILEQNKGSYLGVLWVFISPIIFFLIYYLVFGVIFNGSYSIQNVQFKGPEFALGIFVSLSIFRFISDVLSGSSSSIIKNPNFIKKVVFPLEVLPIVQLSVTVFSSLISLILCLIAIYFVNTSLYENLFWCLIWLPPMIFFTLGISYFVSSLTVFFRDLSKIIETVSIVLLYSSAVFYTVDGLKEKSPALWSVLKFNPILHFVEGFRGCFYLGNQYEIEAYLTLMVFSIAVFFVGTYFFMRNKKQFADFV